MPRMRSGKNGMNENMHEIKFEEMNKMACRLDLWITSNREGIHSR